MTEVELGAIVNQLTELCRQRTDWHRQEKSLTLRMKAICRRVTEGDKDKADDIFATFEDGGEVHPVIAATLAPLMVARGILREPRMHVEKMIEKTAKRLPVWTDWAADVRGLGPLSIGQIVGAAGNLSRYDGPAKLWKRMGLGIVDGERQRRVAGDAALAIRHGYNCDRRSLMWNIGNAIVKVGDVYRAMYLERKAFEEAKANAAGKTVVPAAKITKANAGAHMSMGHVHNRAKRYVEKRILRDMWRAWRGEGDHRGFDAHADRVSPASVVEYV